MEVLCVGNSRSLVGKNLGHIIDSHEIVVRYNNFETTGYEYDVGTKTNWVCYRACDDVRLIDPNKIEKAFTFITYCKHTPGMRMVANIQKAWFGNKLTVVDDRDCYSLANQMNFKNDMTEWPSIGSLSIGYFSSLGYEIKLVGFDFSESHYFKKPPKDGKYHNWKKEKDFVLGLPKVSVLSIL